jgi:hypothetical protein
MEKYIPRPIDVSDVELNGDLIELREAIAENAHDVWAVKRIEEGWIYGDTRNEYKKQTPCMVPYSKLTNSEKEYDRNMAMDTLKLVKKLGYDIVKILDTELYRELLNHIREAIREYRCPECGGIVRYRQVFCDHCGEKLELNWKEL